MKQSRHHAIAVGLSLAAALGLSASAREASERTPAVVDKSGYNLFNPAPAAAMRELNTNRPDKTESPYTVDAGHFQIEMDFVNYTQDHDTAAGADVQSKALGIAPVNLKAGLFNNVDFQVVLDTFDDVRTDDHATGISTRERGFGGVTTRLKINLWGNDGGKTAFGLLPFAEFPVNGGRFDGNRIQGGLILPLAVTLPCGWDMGVMTEFDFNRNDTNNRFHTSFINSVTFGHDIVGKLGGYVEFFSETSTESSAAWVGTVDGGLMYCLTDNIQLDAGINFGVTASAPDVQYFTGLSIRF